MTYFDVGVLRFFTGILLANLIFAESLWAAQEAGTVEGYVVDANTGEPLPGANVLVVEPRFGAATDDNGYYRIIGIPPGTHELRVTMLGYRTRSETVNVTPGQPVRINLSLEIAVLKLSEALTVTAERVETFNTATPLSVVDKVRLQEVKPVTTAEALKDISGISMARPGAWGMKPVIGGLTDDRVVVLVDGARLSQACPMGMDACVATINPDEIERIEVIKGPHSVVYGSGNLGGVINVITKESPREKDGLLKLVPLVSLGYHTISTGKTGRLNIDGGLRQIDFSVSSGLQSFGDYSTPGGEVANSRFSGRDLDVLAGWNFSHDRRLQFSTQQYRGKDIGYPSTSAVIPRESRELYTLTYSARNLSESVSSLVAMVSLQNLSHRMEIRPSGDRPVFRGESSSDTYAASLKANVVPVSNVSLVTGFDYYRWNMDASGGEGGETQANPLISTLPNAGQRDIGMFAEGKLTASKSVDLTLGLRADRVTASAGLADQIPNGDLSSNVIEQFIGANLGLLYRVFRGVNVTASLGRGFKPATPVERYLASPMPDGYQRMGTVDLRPEKSHSVRLAIKGMIQPFQWDAALFQNNLTDFISAEVDPRSTPPDSTLKGVKRYVNLGKATIRGLESNWSFSVTNTFGLSGTVTYTWGEFRSESQPLPQIPPLEANMNLRYSRQNLWGELTGRFVAAQDRFKVQAGELRTPGFFVLNIRGGGSVGERLRLTVGVENVFNRSYREHLNLAQLPEPGRNLYIAIDFGLPSNRNLPGMLFGLGRGTETIVFRAGGIYCIYCERRVKSILTKMDGVVSVEVNVEEERVEVEYEKGKVSVPMLLEALNGAGYEASLIEERE